MRDFDPAARHPQGELGEPGEPGPAAGTGTGTGEPWSRRVFLRTAAGGTAGMAAWSLLSARGSAASAAGRDTGAMTTPGSAPAASVSGPAAKVVSFNAGWLSGRRRTAATSRDSTTATWPR